MNRKQVNKQFLKDVKNHKLEIKIDDGVYRHLTFKRPDTSCYRFDIVTFPEHLVITGDMGDNVFSRIPDMFDFFRGEINPLYWSEKIVAEEPNFNEYRGQKFDIKTLYNNVKEDIKNQLSGRSNTYINRAYKEVIQELELHEVNSRNWHDILSNIEIKGLDFDYCEYDNTIFSYHYLWRCFAITWGIKKYEEMKNNSLQM
jgi:hypothetical protein